MRHAPSSRSQCRGLRWDGLQHHDARYEREEGALPAKVVLMILS